MSTNVLDEREPNVVGLQPFPVPPRSSRRRVTGIDVWLEAWPARGDDLGPSLHRALLPAPCRMVSLDACDTEVGNGRRFRARFVARAPEAHLTDAAVAETLELVAPLAHWSLVRKLEEFDGVPAYPPTAVEIPT